MPLEVFGGTSELKKKITDSPWAVVFSHLKVNSGGSYVCLFTCHSQHY
jgi:hypothetical protein